MISCEWSISVFYDCLIALLPCGLVASLPAVQVCDATGADKWYCCLAHKIYNRLYDIFIDSFCYCFLAAGYMEFLIDILEMGTNCIKRNR